MSLAGANTPYGQTPGFSRSAAPYTPTANTPFMTPFNTPGPSVTPRSGGYGGGSSGTPKQPGASPAPPRQSKGGNMWGAAAEAWGSSQRRGTPGSSRGGEHFRNISPQNISPNMVK